MSLINKIKDTLGIERVVTIEELLHGEKKKEYHILSTAMCSFIGMIGFGINAQAQSPSNDAIMLQIYKNNIEAAKLNIQITSQMQNVTPLQIELANQQLQQALNAYQGYMQSVTSNIINNVSSNVPLSRGGVSGHWNPPFIGGKVGEMIDRGKAKLTPGTTGSEHGDIIGGAAGDLIDRFGIKEEIHKTFSMFRYELNEFFKAVFIDVTDVALVGLLIYLVLIFYAYMFGKSNNKYTGLDKLVLVIVFIILLNIFQIRIEQSFVVPKP